MPLTTPQYHTGRLETLYLQLWFWQSSVESGTNEGSARTRCFHAGSIPAGYGLLCLSILTSHLVQDFATSLLFLTSLAGWAAEPLALLALHPDVPLPQSVESGLGERDIVSTRKFLGTVSFCTLDIIRVALTTLHFGTLSCFSTATDFQQRD